MLFKIKRFIQLPFRRVAHARRAARWRIDRATRFTARLIRGAVHIATWAGWTIFAGTALGLAILAYTRFPDPSDRVAPKPAWVINRNRDMVIERMICGAEPPVVRAKPALVARPRPLISVPPPPPVKIPTFLCDDGTASFATTRRGACASHGGIARPPQLPRIALPPPPEDRAVTLRCADGTVSSSVTRRGACSSHGGIAADRPAKPVLPKPHPTARFCADGSISNAASGACSHHGGLRD